MLKGISFVVAVASVAAASPAWAATTVYTDRDSFLSALGAQRTDAYSPAEGYAPGFSLLSNADMSAVFGETRYQSTGFQDINIIAQEGYCAGCNGSFLLSFTSTSLGTADGVFGVGTDIRFNSPAAEGPYTAAVTFGDLGSTIFSLPTGPSFFGITSDRLINSIAFGPNPSTTKGGFIGIDNLTIGSVVGAVPEPSTWALMLLGFGSIGLAIRRRKVRATIALA